MSDRPSIEEVRHEAQIEKEHGETLQVVAANIVGAVMKDNSRWSPSGTYVQFTTAEVSVIERALNRPAQPEGESRCADCEVIDGLDEWLTDIVAEGRGPIVLAMTENANVGVILRDRNDENQKCDGSGDTVIDALLRAMESPSSMFTPNQQKGGDAHEKTSAGLPSAESTGSVSGGTAHPAARSEELQDVAREIVMTRELQNGVYGYSFACPYCREEMILHHEGGGKSQHRRVNVYHRWTASADCRASKEDE